MAKAKKTKVVAKIKDAAAVPAKQAIDTKLSDLLTIGFVVQPSDVELFEDKFEQALSLTKNIIVMEDAVYDIEETEESEIKKIAKQGHAAYILSNEHETDFSSLRNRVIRQCETQNLLFLDADEETYTHLNKKTLIDEIDNEKYLAYMIEIESCFGANIIGRQQVLRLLKVRDKSGKSTGIKFTGAVKEHVFESGLVNQGNIGEINSFHIIHDLVDEKTHNKKVTRHKQIFERELAKDNIDVQLRIRYAQDCINVYNYLGQPLSIIEMLDRLLLFVDDTKHIESIYQTKAQTYYTMYLNSEKRQSLYHPNSLENTRIAAKKCLEFNKMNIMARYFLGNVYEKREKATTQDRNEDYIMAIQYFKSAVEIAAAGGPIGEQSERQS